jgi:hypothetical protein
MVFLGAAQASAPQARRRVPLLLTVFSNIPPFQYSNIPACHAVAWA